MSRIACPKCFGELAIASPPRQNYEMICRCKQCSRLIIIEGVTVIKKSPPPKAPQDRLPPATIWLNTRLPPVISYAA